MEETRVEETANWKRHQEDETEETRVVEATKKTRLEETANRKRQPTGRY